MFPHVLCTWGNIKRRATTCTQCGTRDSPASMNIIPQDSAAVASNAPVADTGPVAEADATVVEKVADEVGGAQVADVDGGEEEELAAEQQPKPAAKRTIDLDARDEVGRPDVAVRPLTYAWEQTDDEVKIYVPFDQSEELSKGVDASAVKVEFGEWNVLLLIRSDEGVAPLGLRIGDFHQRIDPKLSKLAIRSNRITLKLRKRESSHWFNLLQRAGS
eukprot:NODE_2836_length_867_cov_333.883005.p1 GENE.NODE_2836_length_867_cov_333.883005~~NODE_2836_length_867_cov_333.883005.p1  ORF type:complete len:225 (-),score=48.19 NODE_2836_length_867_cov_333.883005:176-826(-)